MPTSTFSNGTPHPVIARVSHPERFSSGGMLSQRLLERINYVETHYIYAASEAFVESGRRLAYLNNGNVSYAGGEFRTLLRDAFGITVDEAVENLTLGRIAIAVNLRATTRETDLRRRYQERVEMLQAGEARRIAQISAINAAIESQREEINALANAKEAVVTWMNTSQDDTEARFKTFRLMIEALSGMTFQAESPEPISPAEAPEMPSELTTDVSPSISMEHDEPVENRRRSDILAGIGLVRESAGVYSPITTAEEEVVF